MELHVQHMQLAVKTNLATYTVSIFNHSGYPCCRAYAK